MIGPQYELWGVDEGPNAPRVKKPRLHPVYCLTCGTLMYARDEHLGKKLKCPDCGALTTATPRREEATKSVLVPDGEEYQIDELAEPPSRPVSMVQILEAQDQERNAMLQIPAVTAAMAAREKEVFVAPAPRPKRPRNPLVVGVWRMLATQEVIARWVALSLLLGFVTQMLSEALLSPIQGMAEAVKIVFAAVGVALAGIWLSMIGPLLVAIVGESAEGSDELYQAPQWLAFDWFGEFFSVVMSGAVAGVLALGAGELAARAELPVPARIAIGAAVVVFIFPFGLLSTMLEASPIGVISPKLLTTFGRMAGPWLLFYLESFFLAAIVGGIAWLMTSSNTSVSSRELPTAIVWGLPPVMVAAILIQMRLLGRLAWWISDGMPDEEDERKS
jgi:DNA-directed RNA polymerase subunit M/transcription elongation factor TFIIS